MYDPILLQMMYEGLNNRSAKFCAISLMCHSYTNRTLKHKNQQYIIFLHIFLFISLQVHVRVEINTDLDSA